MSCKELSSMSVSEVKDIMSSVDTVMVDCDGVLWHSNSPIEGAPETIRRMREVGKRVFFCTNNSTKTRQEYAQKCENLNFGGDLVSE